MVHFSNLVGIFSASIISLIRLFQFALPRGELENPPSPRGRLWNDKFQFIFWLFFILGDNVTEGRIFSGYTVDT